MFSHPETGSDPPIGSNRESGCDRESLQTLSWSTSIEWARLRPAMTASYSASLLEAWNPNLSAYSISIPSGEVKINPAPLP